MDRNNLRLLGWGMLLVLHVTMVTSKEYIMVDECGEDVFLLPGDEALVQLVDSGTYNDNINCTMYFNSSSPGQLVVTFLEMGIESSAECSEDYVEVTDMSTEETSGRRCGTDLPANFVSKSRNIDVHFQSGNTTGENGSGFKIRVKPVTEDDDFELPAWAITLITIVVIAVVASVVWTILCCCCGCTCCGLICCCIT